MTALVAETVQGVILNILTQNKFDMKRVVLLLVALLVAVASSVAQSPKNLPQTLHAGYWKAGHIQGIAMDAQHKYI